MGFCGIAYNSHYHTCSTEELANIKDQLIRILPMFACFKCNFIFNISLTKYQFKYFTPLHFINIFAIFLLFSYQNNI